MVTNPPLDAEPWGNFNGIDKRITHKSSTQRATAAAATTGTGTALEPLQWPQVPLGWDGHIWALAEVPRAWKSFWDAQRWHEAGEPAELAL